MAAVRLFYIYIYNDAPVGGRVDLHEADWEMVQFLIGDDDKPVTAVYAQHALPSGAPGRTWNSTHPKAAGPSSASDAAVKRPTSSPDCDERTWKFDPLSWDAADGRGRQVTPQLEPMTDPWVRWPGVWGGTTARIPLLDGDSPQAPRLHGQWDSPHAFAAKARDDLPARKPLPAPAGEHRDPAVRPRTGTQIHVHGI